MGPDTIRRMIEPGQDAPHLALPDQDERAIELSES
jgi:peroxiredoxin